MNSFTVQLIVPVALAAGVYFYFFKTSAQSVGRTVGTASVNVVSGAVQGVAEGVETLLDAPTAALVNTLAPVTGFTVDPADVHGVLTGTYNDVVAEKQAVVDQQVRHDVDITLEAEQTDVGLSDADFHAYRVSDEDLLDSGYATRGELSAHYVHDNSDGHTLPPTGETMSEEDRIAAQEADERIARAAAAKLLAEQQAREQQAAAARAADAAAAQRAEAARIAAEHAAATERAAAAAAAQRAQAAAAAARAEAAHLSRDAGQDLNGGRLTEKDYEDAVQTYVETGHVPANMDDEAYW